MPALDPENKAALDQWADLIVGLEPDVAAAVARFSQQIAEVQVRRVLLRLEN